MTRMLRTDAPTARQTECWNAYVQHRTYKAAAAALGVSDNTIRMAVQGYLRRAAMQERKARLSA
jgi:DNA-binding CsgD family transcriptional regulator